MVLFWVGMGLLALGLLAGWTVYCLVFGYRYGRKEVLTWMQQLYEHGVITHGPADVVDAYLKEHKGKGGVPGG